MRWKLEAPFSIEPAAAQLPAKASHTFTVSFLPEEAGSFTGSAACTIDGGATSVTQVGARAQRSAAPPTDSQPSAAPEEHAARPSAGSQRWERGRGQRRTPAGKERVLTGWLSVGGACLARFRWWAWPSSPT